MKKLIPVIVAALLTACHSDKPKLEPPPTFEELAKYPIEMGLPTPFEFDSKPMYRIGNTSCDGTFSTLARAEDFQRFCIKCDRDTAANMAKKKAEDERQWVAVPQSVQVNVKDMKAKMDAADNRLSIARAFHDYELAQLKQERTRLLKELEVLRAQGEWWKTITNSIMPMWQNTIITNATTNIVTDGDRLLWFDH